MTDPKVEAAHASVAAIHEFEAFGKIPRLNRECQITEKIDGTNAQVLVTEDGDMAFGSRSRWLTEAADNFGFARWGVGNKSELLKLGPGRHYGEWWGAGIGRRYGQAEKRFSLFNVDRWGGADRPACCDVVPLLYQGPFNSLAANSALETLKLMGSQAAPGFMDPEGIIVWHTAARIMFKATVKGDEKPKGSME